MRGFIALLCLIAVAIILEGCGGGGGSSTTCLNKQIDLVSQSLKGTMTVSVAATVNKTTPLVRESSDITEQMDLKKWNFRMETSTSSVKVTLPNGMPMDVKVEVRVIFMAAKKMAVVWHKLTNNTSGHTLEQDCISKNITNLPAPEMLSSYLDAAKHILQANAKCGGNDGTYDMWNILANYDGPFPPPFPPLPHLPNGSVDVKYTNKVEMDKDFLLHSSSGSLNVQADVQVPHIGDTKGSMQETDHFGVSHATSGGPAEADLDYSKWGACHPAKDLDINTLFQPVLGSKASFVLTKIKSRGFFQKHILATIQASLKSQHTSTVVV